MGIVTLYINNRVDQAEPAHPEQLAEEFVAALDREDYMPGGRPSIEFEYRWWLTGPAGKHASWDADDWPALWEGLTFLLNNDEAARERVMDFVYGEAV